MLLNQCYRTIKEAKGGFELWSKCSVELGCDTQIHTILSKELQYDSETEML